MGSGQPICLYLLRKSSPQEVQAGPCCSNNHNINWLFTLGARLKSLTTEVLLGSAQKRANTLLSFTCTAAQLAGRTNGGEQVVLQHEALGRQRVAAVRVEQRDDDRHVRACRPAPHAREHWGGRAAAGASRHTHCTAGTTELHFQVHHIKTGALHYFMQRICRPHKSTSE